LVSCQGASVFLAAMSLSSNKKALSQHPFDTVWLPDHLSYENVFVSLAAAHHAD
jgi:hypothetical protein